LDIALEISSSAHNVAKCTIKISKKIINNNFIIQKNANSAILYSKKINYKITKKVAP
jgi:hypothetical protein